MIDPRDCDRLRCVIESIPGVKGFALALTFDNKIEVQIGGTLNPAAAAQGIVDVAEEAIRAQGEERPLRVN